MIFMENIYQKPWWLTEKVSNNAFHFEERTQPRLYVPSLKEGTIEDVREGTQVVFEDFDDNGILRSCTGLEHFIRTPHPAYIFDNHQHALFFWAREFHAGKLRSASTLVHVDQHKDNRIPETFLSREEFLDPKKVFEYTNRVLNVGNFIPAAQHAGLIKDVIFINSQASIEAMNFEQLETKFSKNTSPNSSREQTLILDVDLDFFAPEFDYIPDRLKFECVERLLPLADVITVATSPFFIDQKRAIERLHQLLQSFPFA